MPLSSKILIEGTYNSVKFLNEYFLFKAELKMNWFDKFLSELLKCKILSIHVQWNSRTLLEYRTESNRIEFFQYFDVFSSSVRSELIKIIQMHQIHHVKSFKCNKREFEKTSKYWKSSDPAKPCLIRFSSVRFGSVPLDDKSSRVSLYVI